MDGVANRVPLSQIIVNVIEALSPEMPGLFGNQWSSVEYKIANMLQRALSELQNSRRDQLDEWREAEVELLYSLFDLFSTSRRASNRLAEVLESFIGPIDHLKSMDEPGEGSRPRPLT